MIEDLITFKKTYDFLLWLKPKIEKFSKAHKYSLGIRLEDEMIELLRKIIEANYSKEGKKKLIREAIIQYEIIKILIRISKDFKLISLKQYEYASEKLLEIGKLLGGWHKRFSK